MELKGKELHISKLKHNIDRSIFLVRCLLAKEVPEADLLDNINSIKKTLSDNIGLLGEDFCIEEGIRLERFLDQYRKQ